MLGKVSVAPDLAAGVMSARDCRAIARVRIAVEDFVVFLVDVWVLVNIVV